MQWRDDSARGGPRKEGYLSFAYHSTFSVFNQILCYQRKLEIKRVDPHEI